MGIIKSRTGSVIFKSSVGQTFISHIIKRCIKTCYVQHEPRSFPADRSEYFLVEVHMCMFMCIIVLQSIYINTSQN